MEDRCPQRPDDDQSRASRGERDDEERPQRRPSWARDSEIARSVNAAVQDVDFDD